MKRAGLLLSACVLAVMGCNKGEEKKNINVTVPGVNIQIDPKGGPNIQVPGVNIQVDPTGGPKIQVPGVTIDGANIKIEPPK